MRKIQETSKMIKQQLMSPDNSSTIDSFSQPTSESTSESPEISRKSNRLSKDLSRARLKEKKKAALRMKLKARHSQQLSDSYNVKEMHNQIINHILKMNYGRKQNLINADNTGYDAAIQQIYKQKSLELSKALREMSHQEKPEASKIVNAIIPDFAIKLEELPIDVIRELSSTFETFETDIGEMNGISSYDWVQEANNANNSMVRCNLTYSLNTLTNLEMDQDLPHSEVEGSYSNPENPDSLVVKIENIESEIKSEPIELVDLIDSENKDEISTNMNSVMNEIEQIERSSSKENDSQTQCEENNEKCASVIRSENTPLDLNEDPCYNYELSDLRIIPQQSLSTGGPLRVSKNIFVEPNEIFQDQSQDIPVQFIEKHEISYSSGENIDSIPRVEINPNISDEIKNVLSENCTKTNTEEGRLSPQNISTSNFISLTIKPFSKPKTLMEATKMMLQIDEEIEKLTKLRQKIIISMTENPLYINQGNKNKRKKSANKRKRFNKNQSGRSQNIDSNTRIQQENGGLNNSVGCSQPNNAVNASAIGHELNENIDNLNRDDLAGTAVICKIVNEEKLILIGTDQGIIQIFHFNDQENMKIIRISSSAITCLESAFSKSKCWVYTGTSSEAELNMLDYKKSKLYVNRRKFRLEDGIQVIQKDGIHLFIGGCSGYLTRFNCQSEKIEFEDRVSEMGIKDLRITREGPRRILLMLLTNESGYSQIHVRDAMSTLHIRTIIENVQNVGCLLVRNTSLFFSLNQEIMIYNFCDGQYIAKIVVPTDKRISIIESEGNILLACTSQTIYMYNILTRNLLETLQCDSISSIASSGDKVVIGTCLKQLKTLHLPETVLAINEKYN
ncbi:hypothetical protein HHI36_001360 [Cryptolaemus montrouzieri]|uniref:Uncharacterized protein n=1 Tax=Cryptolaemus montrouzieri TaxID=559131 RepID=A0ABD2P860_9CUCU